MDDVALEAAKAAGWNPQDGDPPFVHTPPPPVDPNLNNNGIPSTDAPQVL